MIFCHTQSFLNFDHYYMDREADIGGQCWGEVAKDVHQKLYSGFFLPGNASHLKSLVANGSPSMVESKREVSEIKKRRGSAEVPQQHRWQKDLTDNPALRLRRICLMFFKVSDSQLLVISLKS